MPGNTALEINWSLSHQTFTITPTARLASIIVQGISYFPPPRFLLEYYKVYKKIAIFSVKRLAPSEQLISNSIVLTQSAHRSPLDKGLWSRLKIRL